MASIWSLASWVVSQMLGQKIVAGVTFGNVDDRAGFAELGDIYA